MANGIKREALILYLDDLRTLESLVAINDIKIAHLEKEKNRLKGKIDEIEKKKNQPFCFQDPPGMPAEPGAAVPILVVVIVCAAIFGIWLLLCQVPLLGEIVEFLGELLFIPYIIFSVIGLIWAISDKIRYSSAKKDHQRMMREYHQDMERYEQNKEQAMRDHENRKNECTRLQNALRSIIDQFSHEQEDLRNSIRPVMESRSKAYSANIIPMQFRSIYGVYYLYDYLAYSDEPLSTALVQANLQSIKDKMDEIIKLNMEQIRLQKRSINENRDYHRRMLEQAYRTEENTRVAAQYQKVYAVNSEAALALQKEQLAWQRAQTEYARQQTAIQKTDLWAKQLGLY